MTRSDFLSPISRSLFTSVLILGGLLTGTEEGESQQGRKHIAIPDVPGYQVLKADFHMHTIFSDGQVLPTTRVGEAWREGLDVISITDHDTMDPEHVVGDKNTPFAMARGAAESYGILLIPGSEITRFQRPDRVGHFNALFLSDANPVVGKDYYEAIKAAVDQGGFIFLNHPSESWNSYEWKEEFQRLERGGMIHGVEVINGDTYYDNAHRWVNEKGLTAMGTSDLHGPSGYTFGYEPAGHRPMTLVFARERTVEGVREALFAGRTVVYSRHMLYGSPQLLKALFDASVTVRNREVTITANGIAYLEVLNESDVDFQLTPNEGSSGWVAVEGDPELEASGSVLVPARRVARIAVRNPSEGKTGTAQVRLRYRVANLWVAQDTGLEVEIPLTVRVVPEG